MPSLNSSSTSSGEGFTIPWKAVALVVLIGGAGYYTWYQYERLFPTPKKAQMAAKKQPDMLTRSGFAPIMEKLNLSADQKQDLVALATGTTDPKEMRREAMKILTPDQKLKAVAMRKEIAAAQQLNKAKREERVKKYLPGADLEYAKAANQRMKEERERRKAEQQKAATPAASPNS